MSSREVEYCIRNTEKTSDCSNVPFNKQRINAFNFISNTLVYFMYIFERSAKIVTSSNIKSEAVFGLKQVN